MTYLLKNRNATIKAALAGVLSFYSLESRLALADPLNIVDCNGSTRASQQVNANTLSDVKVKVVDEAGNPANGGKARIARPDGTVIEADITNGVATFYDVAPGTWVLTSPNNHLFFMFVTIRDAVSLGEAIGALSGVTLLGGGAAVGSAIAIHNATSGGGSSTSSPSGPTPNPSVAPTPCLTCNPDQNAPSVPPFGRQKVQGQTSTPLKNTKANIVKIPFVPQRDSLVLNLPRGVFKPSSAPVAFRADRPIERGQVAPLVRGSAAKPNVSQKQIYRPDATKKAQQDNRSSSNSQANSQTKNQKKR